MPVEKVYWDSDAFLGLFQNEPGKAKLCEATIDKAKAGDVLIVTSTLTMAETLWMRNQPKVTADKAALVQRYFRRSYVRVYNVTRKIAEAAQDLVWNHDIRPKDAIHVATALELGITVLETFDEGLIAKSGTIGTPPLIIRKPQEPKQGKLDFGS